MTSSIASQVFEFCQENGLLARGDRVVVGVSGGPDSLCLLHLLTTLRERLDLSLTVAHLNHQLRGEDSQADADFVRQVAASWDLPAFIEIQPVASLAAQFGQSLEEAARQIRYTFLGRVAEEVAADKIAVGHNADDQVETVVMHFLRGAGLNGLRGMLSRVELDSLRLAPAGPPAWKLKPRPLLIRPLLEITRAEIEGYCQENGLVPRQDSSNEDTTFFRNRLRHELIPYLETYNPNIRQVIRRLADVAAAEAELLAEDLNQAWRFVARRQAPDSIEFDRPDWLALPLALKRSTLRRAVQSLRRSLRDINFEHIKAAVAAVEKGQTGAQATLPQGLLLTIGYDSFTIAPAAITQSAPDPDRPQLLKDQVLKVTLPGLTPLPFTNWQLRADLITSGTLTQRQVSQVGAWETYLDAEAVGPAPVLRRRRPGDTFRPLGLGGHSQKVNEFMINQKIPASQRNTIPLLVSGDQVMWVCGYRITDPARLTSTTQRVVHLRFERR